MMHPLPVLTVSSESAKLTAEIFARLVELEECEIRSAANLCRRLATLADLSPTMFLITARFGSGDISAVTQSFADMAQATGWTRQALHYEWQRELAKVELVFPRLAELMHESRFAADDQHEPNLA
jgi:hypothetical protein